MWIRASGSQSQMLRLPNAKKTYVRKGAEPLRKLASRVVGVDILGHVNDPGFKE